MMIRLRKRKGGEIEDGQVEAAPFTLSVAGGASSIYLPADVAASLRYTIGRVAREGGFPRRLALFATLFGEGVTFLSRAMGALIANDYGLRVAVVELNWWRPSPPLIRTDEHPGLAGLINMEAAPDDVLIRTGLSNFSIVQAGDLAPAHRAMTARSTELQDGLDQLAEDFDHLILDIPAILATSDAVPLAGLAESCCLVVRQGVTPIEQVSLALDEICHLPLAGVILNQVELVTPERILRFIPHR